MDEIKNEVMFDETPIETENDEFENSDLNARALVLGGTAFVAVVGGAIALIKAAKNGKFKELKAKHNEKKEERRRKKESKKGKIEVPCNVEDVK